jgi:hypothetical protein
MTKPVSCEFNRVGKSGKIRGCGQPATHRISVNPAEGEQARANAKEAGRDIMAQEVEGLRKETPVCGLHASHACHQLQAKGHSPRVTEMSEMDHDIYRAVNKNDKWDNKVALGSGAKHDSGVMGDTVGTENPFPGRPYKSTRDRGDGFTQGGITQPAKTRQALGRALSPEPGVHKDLEDGVEIRVGRGNAPKTAAAGGHYEGGRFVPSSSRSPGRSSGSRATGADAEERLAGQGAYDVRTPTEKGMRERQSAQMVEVFNAVDLHRNQRPGTAEKFLQEQSDSYERSQKRRLSADDEDGDGLSNLAELNSMGPSRPGRFHPLADADSAALPGHPYRTGKFYEQQPEPQRGPKKGPATPKPEKAPKEPKPPVVKAPRSTKATRQLDAENLMLNTFAQQTGHHPEHVRSFLSSRGGGNTMMEKLKLINQHWGKPTWPVIDAQIKQHVQSQAHTSSDEHGGEVHADTYNVD